MFQPLRALWKGPWYKKLILIISLTIASLYPIFRNYDSGVGIYMYDRHVAFMEKNSHFYNPWQYRVFCPMLVEGVKWVYDHTIDKIVPLETVMHFDPAKAADKSNHYQWQMNDKQAVIYNGIFIVLRFILNALTYVFAFLIFAKFTRSNQLNGLGLLLLSFAMGNAVFNSDLSLNLYLDLILFMWMACILLYKGNAWWILPITIIGALNRETALLVPAMYFLGVAANTNKEKPLFGIKLLNWLKNPSRQTWMITIISTVIFFIIYYAIRSYYGFREPGMIAEKNLHFGWELIKVNAFSKDAPRVYFEIYGVLGFLPFTCLLIFRQSSLLIRIWTVLLLPIWIGIHFVSTMANESRYYLVTLVLALIPMVLEAIKRDEVLVKE